MFNDKNNIMETLINNAFEQLQKNGVIKYNIFDNRAGYSDWFKTNNMKHINTVIDHVMMMSSEDIHIPHPNAL